VTFYVFWNGFTRFLELCRHCQKISEKSVHNFLSYLADTQTDRQTNKQTNKVWQKHNFLGGGKNFENLSIIGKDMDKSKLAGFWSTLYIIMLLCAWQRRLCQKRVDLTTWRSHSVLACVLTLVVSPSWCTAPGLHGSRTCASLRTSRVRTAYIHSAVGVLLQCVS